MINKGTKIIETERLILRPFKMSDAQAMYSNWANNDEVTKYLIWPTHSSVEITQLLLADWTTHYNEKNYYQWAIVLKENGEEPIGGISVVDISESLENVEIGYSLGRKWWNRGIVTEAFNALIKFFFEEVGAQKVYARHDVNNPASGRVMQKCGLKFEGIIRREMFVKGTVRDMAHYSILKSEYQSQNSIER